MVTSLSTDGHLFCSYMGTDPSFFSTPKVDAREADYEQVEAEMKKMQRLIREATRTQGRRAADASATSLRCYYHDVCCMGMATGTQETVFFCNFRHPA